ncbi:MAG: hypothetical protein V4591_05605, partial [Bdellovibrionota bacterium]
MAKQTATAQKIKKTNNNNKERLKKAKFSATFLGVRGTVPTLDRGFLKYGGNTSCVEVTSVFKKESIHILFDAGTGIINYTEKAIKRKVRVFHLFLSHMHYDHII